MKVDLRLSIRLCAREDLCGVVVFSAQEGDVCRLSLPDADTVSRIFLGQHAFGYDVGDATFLEPDGFEMYGHGMYRVENAQEFGAQLAAIVNRTKVVGIRKDVDLFASPMDDGKSVQIYSPGQGLTRTVFASLSWEESRSVHDLLHQPGEPQVRGPSTKQCGSVSFHGPDGFESSDTVYRIASVQAFRENLLSLLANRPADIASSPKVDHPAHYGGKNNPYEAIKVIRAWKLGFALGNAIKYIARAGKKSGESAIDDLRKARWYLDNEIESLINSVSSKDD